MIYLLGSRHSDVRRIQQTLADGGFDPGPIDGIFGKKTRRAVELFQKQAQINADGIVGPVTWGKLMEGQEAPKTPDLRVPGSRRELVEIFGDPLVGGYWNAYGGFCPVPENLNHAFNYKHDDKPGFWCHKILVPVFGQVFDKISESNLSEGVATFDGCYNLRNIRGRSKLSMHSWGIAVDLNAKTNWLGSKGDMDPQIIEIFKESGFKWGGEFRRKDPMHFEYTKNGL